jgi:hypothetical protein
MRQRDDLHAMPDQASDEKACLEWTTTAETTIHQRG